jgi:hypothetical protein
MTPDPSVGVPELVNRWLPMIYFYQLCVVYFES